MGCLYRINFDNGMSYIGISTKTLSTRMNWHEKKSRKTDYGGSILYRAMNKYRGHYHAETLIVCDDWESLTIMEKKAIEIFNTKHPFGYNMTLGGEGTVGLPGYWLGKKRPPRTGDWSAKKAASMIGNQYAKGLVHTKESRAKMGTPNNQHAKGKRWTLSEEQKKKYSRKKTIFERAKIAFAKSLAGAIRNGREFSFLPEHV